MASSCRQVTAAREQHRGGVTVPFEFCKDDAELRRDARSAHRVLVNVQALPVGAPLP